MEALSTKNDVKTRQKFAGDSAQVSPTTSLYMIVFKHEDTSFG